jgi:hypothetical protein
MRYSYIAKGEPCTIEVELSSDRVVATIYRDGPETEILSVYNAVIDTSRGFPDPEVFGEQVARDALADYEVSVDPRVEITAYSDGLKRLP